ncbi:hypothetical protein, partial [Mesorhizobium sp.]|uniref:hypothetical protein n=1 Tax=Mesorhizobium sp. TaxID=1871066 RepID=UPI00257C66BC
KIESVLQDRCNPDFFNTIGGMLPIRLVDGNEQLAPIAAVRLLPTNDRFPPLRSFMPSLVHPRAIGLRS